MVGAFFIQEGDHIINVGHILSEQERDMSERVNFVNFLDIRDLGPEPSHIGRISKLVILSSEESDRHLFENCQIDLGRCVLSIMRLIAILSIIEFLEFISEHHLLPMQQILRASPSRRVI